MDWVPFVFFVFVGFFHLSLFWMWLFICFFDVFLFSAFNEILDFSFLGGVSIHKSKHPVSKDVEIFQNSKNFRENSKFSYICVYIYIIYYIYTKFLE